MGDDTMKYNKSLWIQRRRRICEIVEAGSAEDIVSRCYDVFSTLMTLVNVFVMVLYTFDRMELEHGTVLVPKGDLMLLEGDHIILYSQERVHGANTIHI